MDHSESLRRLKETRKSVEDVLSDINQHIWQIEDNLVRKACPRVEKRTLNLSCSNICPASPIGYCAFDTTIDPWCDDCLFCGLPADRG
jgi:hypothetical protein